MLTCYNGAAAGVGSRQGLRIGYSRSVPPRHSARKTAGRTSDRRQTPPAILGKQMQTATNKATKPSGRVTHTMHQHNACLPFWPGKFEDQGEVCTCSRLNPSVWFLPSILTGRSINDCAFSGFFFFFCRLVKTARLARPVRCADGQYFQLQGSPHAPLLYTRPRIRQ